MNTDRNSTPLKSLNDDIQHHHHHHHCLKKLNPKYSYSFGTTYQKGWLSSLNCFRFVMSNLSLIFSSPGIRPALLPGLLTSRNACSHTLWSRIAILLLHLAFAYASFFFFFAGNSFVSALYPFQFLLSSWSGPVNHWFHCSLLDVS